MREIPSESLPFPALKSTDLFGAFLHSERDEEPRRGAERTRTERSETWTRTGLDALCRALAVSEERALARDSERITPFSRSKTKRRCKASFFMLKGTRTREEGPTTSTLWAKPVKGEGGLDAPCRA